MTEKTIRTRLRRAGWRTTNYACVNLLLSAARTKNNLIRTCWTSGSGRFTKNHDHHEITKRKCHLGTRIPFTDLPEDCQRLVVSDYMDLWNLK